MEKYRLVPGDAHRTQGVITCRRLGCNERQKQYWEDDTQCKCAFGSPAIRHHSLRLLHGTERLPG
jgi:hypothetical protein